jgi:hypothetical protein
MLTSTLVDTLLEIPTPPTLSNGTGAAAAAAAPPPSYAAIPATASAAASNPFGAPPQYSVSYDPHGLQGSMLVSSSLEYFLSV